MRVGALSALGTATPGGVELENDGAPVSGGPFGTLDAKAGTFADEGGGKASYTPPPVGPFPASGPCVDIGTPASGWVTGGFPGTPHSPTSVAYSPSLDKFCAVGAGRSYLSDDGITWVLAASGLSFVQSLVWSVDRSEFVAVGVVDAVTGRWHTSPDGVTWATGTFAIINGLPAVDPTIYKVVWSGPLSLYLLVGNTGTPPAGGIPIPLSMTSPDGQVWTDTSPATPGPFDNSIFFDVVWSDDFGIFVACGFQVPNGIVASSATGSGWSIGSTPVSDVHTWQSIAYSPDWGVFVMGGGQGTGGSTGALAAKSFDGLSFSPVSTPSDAQGGDASGAAYFAGFQGGKFLLGGKFGTGSPYYNLLESVDGGATWTANPFQGLTGQFAYSPTFNTVVGTSPRGSSSGSDFSRNSGPRVPCTITAKQVTVISPAIPPAPVEGVTFYSDPTTGHPSVIQADGTIIDLTAPAPASLPWPAVAKFTATADPVSVSDDTDTELNITALAGVVGPFTLVPDGGGNGTVVCGLGADGIYKVTLVPNWTPPATALSDFYYEWFDTGTGRGSLFQDTASPGPTLPTIVGYCYLANGSIVAGDFQATGAVDPYSFGLVLTFDRVARIATPEMGDGQIIVKVGDSTDATGAIVDQTVVGKALGDVFPDSPAAGYVWTAQNTSPAVPGWVSLPPPAVPPTRGRGLGTDAAYTTGSDLSISTLFSGLNGVTNPTPQEIVVPRDGFYLIEINIAASSLTTPGTVSARLSSTGGAGSIQIWQEEFAATVTSFQRTNTIMIPISAAGDVRVQVDVSGAPGDFATEVNVAYLQAIA